MGCVSDGPVLLLGEVPLFLVRVPDDAVPDHVNRLPWVAPPFDAQMLLLILRDLAKPCSMGGHTPRGVADERTVDALDRHDD